MSAYEDTRLAARFAALATDPLPADWEDVLERAGEGQRGRRRLADPLQRRRRGRLVVIVAVALVVVVGAASALAVRAGFHLGIVGLAPVGATPSAPTSGELVLKFMFGHTPGDPGRFTVDVYADGRMIWSRFGDPSTGYLEQRLTPEGVELLRAEVRSTGLVDHDLNLWGDVGLRLDQASRDR
jgi:diadenosine tetraphosphatase ApaH/serine/threonine PP2A family protein phosphatase